MSPKFPIKKHLGLHLLKETSEICTLVETTEAGTPKSVGWSRDSREVVYDSANRIILRHIDTNDDTFLIAGNHPSWSPDGKWIAYRRPDGTAALISPDGIFSQHILDSVRLGAGLRWSPDSQYLLFSDFNAGRIRVLDLADGRIATVFYSIDIANTWTGLRWLHGLPN